jgi:precorrin-6B methylase 2
MADEQPDPVDSLPALRAAGPRSRGPAVGTYVVAIAALAAAAIVVLLVGKPWSSGDPGRSDPPRRIADSVQARFDAERAPTKVVEALGIGPGARVADVGANTGLFTVHLARAVAPTGKVVATDIDAGVLGLLVDRVEQAGLADVVEPRVVPADSPGLEPTSYDAILLSRVDDLLADPVEWLRTAKAALKPSGRIAITNLLHHRAKGMAAARQAGLELISESAPTPTDYVAVFR